MIPHNIVVVNPNHLGIFHKSKRLKAMSFKYVCLAAQFVIKYVQRHFPFAVCFPI